MYDDLKKKLLDKGIPESEIAYIHDAKTEAAKKELFGKVRSGEVRVLIGSTQKMGAGTERSTETHCPAPYGLSVAAIRSAAARGTHYPARQ